MFKLLKGGYCYTPDEIGIKDILVVGNKIYKIEESIPEIIPWELKIIDCKDKIVCPAFIDQHVHIIGGGGEQGPQSRIPELMLGDLISSGISTVVGVLGVDGITRSIGGLLAKAKALEIEGLSTFIYTGSYAVPTDTLTGKAISDLVNVDKVLGIGEIAIADYRSSHPTLQMLMEVAYEAKVGGMIGGKAGVVHIHVGDGKEGISALEELVRKSSYPIEMFVPTHLNRNVSLFNQAMNYVREGGRMDLTAGEKTGKGYSVPDALAILVSTGVNMENITVSSDGNGSMPTEEGNRTGIGKVSQLYEDIRQAVLLKKLDMSTVLKTVTANVAKVLKLYPVKGTLIAGSDADILVLDKSDLTIKDMLVKGEIFIEDTRVVRKGKFEI